MNPISHTNTQTFYPKGQLNAIEQQALARANTAEQLCVDVYQTVLRYDEVKSADGFYGQKGYVKLNNEPANGHCVLSANAPSF